MNQAIQFAPHLYFHRRESHFLARPDEFRAQSRLLRRGSGSTMAWCDSHQAWEDEAPRRPEQLGPSWANVLDQIQQEVGAARLVPTRNGDVTRPFDGRNLWPETDGRGFTMELRDGFGRGGSGAIACPIFYDVVNADVHGAPYVMLIYWFFYIWNWNIILTHQGDWEHITLYFRKDDFESGNRPSWIFFAGHEGGKFISIPDRYVEWTDDHVWVFVSPWGHPSLNWIHDRYRWKYDCEWKSWEHGVLPLEKEPWHLFCGGWGDTHSIGFMRGPLGPYFKAGRDREG